VHFGSDARILPLEPGRACAKLQSQSVATGGSVDLTPGEKAVLGQIRALYATEAREEHQLKALMMQWPPIHHAAYKRAYGGLLAKLLIQDVNAQVFRLTAAGLNAIGVAILKRRPQASKA
jgi:hypothetical protein